MQHELQTIGKTTNPLSVSTLSVSNLMLGFPDMENLTLLLTYSCQANVLEYLATLQTPHKHP
jgi:hypothetical protein